MTYVSERWEANTCGLTLMTGSLRPWRVSAGSSRFTVLLALVVFSCQLYVMLWHTLHSADSTSRYEGFIRSPQFARHSMKICSNGSELKTTFCIAVPLIREGFAWFSTTTVKENVLSYLWFAMNWSTVKRNLDCCIDSLVCCPLRHVLGVLAGHTPQQTHHRLEH